ncbi:MAG: hypothetical protein IH906_01540 [Proteobacteria bacterium]|nr:hypothetical protein [Pseudomonadota bacterium]
MDVEPDKEALFNEVYDEEHVPNPMNVPGVGETPIVPPMAAISNAVENALGIRFSELPMSPPRVLKAIDGAGREEA